MRIRATRLTALLITSPEAVYPSYKLLYKAAVTENPL